MIDNLTSTRNSQGIKEKGETYSIQNKTNDSYVSNQNEQLNFETSKQLNDQTISSKIVIISPIRKESQMSDKDQNIFRLNTQKFGLDSQNINLDRIRSLMTNYASNKSYLKEINNVTKKQNDPHSQSRSYSKSSITQLLNETEQLPQLQKYTLKDIFYRTPIGPVFHDFKKEIAQPEGEQKQFMMQFGGSIMLYFKTLKLLLFCIIFMSLMSLFQLILNISINITDPNDKAQKQLDEFLYGASIAPIASLNRNCNLKEINYSNNDYQFSCPQGFVNVDSIIIGTINNYTSFNSKDCYYLDPFFDVNHLQGWKNTTQYQDLFNTCDGQKKCSFDIISLALQKREYLNNLIYISNSCKGNLEYLSTIEAQYVYLTTVSIAIAYLIGLLVILYLLWKMRENFYELTQKQMILSSMFSLEISPFQFIESKDEIKDQLWEFIENTVREEQRFDADDLIVIDINFSQSRTVYLKLQQVKQLVKIRDENLASLLSKFEQIFNLSSKVEISIQELQSFGQILSQNKELQKIINKIIDCQQKVSKIVEEDVQKNLECHLIDFAWITFDTIQKKQIFENKMKNIGCCKRNENLKFLQSYLKVRKAHASDNIIWDHLQYSSFSLFLRRFLSVLVTLTLFIICNMFIGIFRFSQMFAESDNASSQSTFWFLIAIFAVDKILKFVNKKLTKFEKYKTHSYSSKMLIHKLFFIELLNIVLMCIISNFFYSLQIFKKSESMKFIWVDQQFFISVVQVISLKLLIDIAKHPLAVFIYLIAKKLSQFYDRKFQNSINISRKLLLKDWIEMYTYEDFPLEKRYSQLLVTFYAAFLFGSAVPLLFSFVLFYLILLFWIDKIYFFRYSRKPKIQESQQFDVFFKLIQHLFPLTCLANCVFFGSPVLFNIEDYFMNDYLDQNIDKLSGFAPIYRDFFGISITTCFTFIVIFYFTYQVTSIFINNPLRTIQNTFSKSKGQLVYSNYSTQSFLEFCNEQKILKLKLNLEKKIKQSVNQNYKQKLAKVLQYIDNIKLNSVFNQRNNSIIGSFDYYQNEK
ncbi:calcium-activated chloride channel protein (macronuclear) [Tetrahymena thermophila SB210]|uniref:Calcium-activated chloride channel protein n=1 Tax=Tetrahymena thermophila (strain SB210) TaxID=312017 RepID=I7MJP6_TETTS|nr:calcium-activated chloride channel protein [Tetrahymena thermophila SB210]EAR96508.2 calcium-activated chloride channel protein [Tetrahymena thermophila SB210]|eukprot:XP_001016753.2 calcium-activated chloride channel protein [Tetrahymena thermophila SB210]